MRRAQDVIQFTKQPFIEDAGPRKIKSIQFSMQSGAEIRKSSEVQVWRGVYYDPSKKPIENGLLDRHMGTSNKQSGVCETCHGIFTDCPGHFGNMTLDLPVYHVGYLTTIVNILKCICKVF